ncbi:hypothetical protein QBC45DRAFT_196913 [Copromyces sp. CBS 386.78]|nr:hypothetical protein QBC45DRAFT_196913 [Copromyces sp. CBS 386.78]
MRLWAWRVAQSGGDGAGGARGCGRTRSGRPSPQPWLFPGEHELLKGRALEEIDELFERKVPAWKFKSAETWIVTCSDALKEVRQRGEIGEEDRGKAATVEKIVEGREKV